MATTPATNQAARDEDSSTEVSNTDVTADMPQRFTQSEIVTIFVGPKRKKYLIHKDLLCAKSEYFRASLSENWTEGKKNEVYWNDECDTIEVVEEMTNWLYGRHLELDVSKQGTLRHVLMCYSFADKRIMVDFKNTLTDVLRASCKEKNIYGHVRELVSARKLQLEATPLYTFLLRSFLSGMIRNKAQWAQGGEHAKTLARHLEDPDVSKELAIELVQEMLKYLKAPHGDPARLEGCHFHDQTAVAARGQLSNT
ncbi:hypothetical protein LTR70_000871 [Exophiala xenobiotica]|nr:hypothetical protein LTR70_000871 [Exophiala xenobiotica]